MSDNNDLTLAKLEAAAEIVSAFAESMNQPVSYAAVHHKPTADLLATVFKAVWKAIDESVTK